MSTESIKRSGLLKFWESVIPNGENGDPILITWYPVSVVLAVSASSGKVQFTLSSPERVKAGTAVWIDWTPGVVAANTASWFQGPVTAVRGVSSAGVVIMEVAQYQNR